MENIFLKEEQVVAEAEKLLSSGMIETESDKAHYQTLLDEYKRLLKQLVMLIKISDLNQYELNSLSKKLGIASKIDALTGLFNRRYFNETYQKEWLSAARTKSSLAVIMIDIDFFKKYNDRYGHLQGDECLKAVATAIRSSILRPRDMVARFGGEEFVVLLPDTDTAGAEYIAGRIIAGIGKQGIPHSDSSVSDTVTVSIGIAASIPEKNDSSNKLLDMADKALYRAKLEGRNCYRIYIYNV